MRALLLALSALVAAWRAVGQAATTRCTEQACFTLHEKKAPFEVAKTLCYDNGGYLLTMRDQEEVEDARALLALAGEAGLFMRGKEKLWIGLKLAKGSCVLDGEPLRGFRWESGTRDSSAFINWSREPRSTCTEERCVTVRASTAGSGQLEWSDGSCKDSALYACRFQFKGMCEPLTLAGPGDITYTPPFSGTPLHEGSSLRMLPHGTLADITCTSSEEHYYSVICDKAGASAGFSWTPAGPFCPSGERTCAHQNGGCQHVCSDEGIPGKVRCSCREGYYLGDDTVTCFPKNHCKNAPCVHECVNEGASFRCACRKGYQLAQDEIDCVDVNECEERVCGVHACHNLPGSYECACQKGFEKGAGGACVDVDECAKGACGRSAYCLNSQGSFSCYCSTGFRSSLDADEGCVDVDECVNRPCEDICTNTVGSFLCSCRANFQLADNGISCIQVITEPSQHAPASHQPPTSGGHEETTTTTATSTLTLPFSSESSSTEAEDSEHRDSLSRSWVLVWVLGSVIPLLLIVALTSVIAVLRWNRARKEAKKKNATADNYCWVSSGFQIQPENEPN